MSLIFFSGDVKFTKLLSLLESLKIDKISKLTVKGEASLFYPLNIEFKWPFNIHG